MATRFAQRGQWLAAGLVPLAAAAMWAAWVTPLLQRALASGLVAPRGATVPGWVVLALLLGGSASRRCRCAAGWRAAVCRAALGLLAILGAVAVVFCREISIAGLGPWARAAAESLTAEALGYPAPLIVLLAAALLWLWGTAATWTDYGEVLVGFGLGVVALSALLLAEGDAGWPAGSAWTSVLAFLVSALLCLGLASVQRVLAREGLAAPQVSLQGRVWLRVVAGAVAAVLALGWLLASFVSPQAVAAALAPVWRWIAVLVDRLLLGFAYVAFAVLEPVIRLLEVVYARVFAALGERLGEFVRGMEEAATRREALPPPDAAGRAAILAWFRVALVVLLALGVVAALYVAYMRRRRAEPGAGDVRESVLSPALLRAQLQALQARLRRPEAIEPYLRLEGDDPRQAIRRTYRRLLSAIGRRGRARSPGETPRALARALAQEGLLATEAEALATLTEAYLLARYAPEPPTAQQCAAASDAWAQIEQRLGDEAGGTREGGQ